MELRRRFFLVATAMYGLLEEEQVNPRFDYTCCAEYSCRSNNCLAQCDSHTLQR
jgi:hypothetical protein